MKRCRWILLVLLIATSCGAVTAPTSTSTPTFGTISPTALPAPRGPIVIEVERSGGLAGQTQRCKVYADGQVRSGSPEAAFQISPEEVNTLLAEIGATGFFDLKDVYGTSSSCQDCFTTKIMVNNGSEAKTVAIVEGAADVPPEVSAIFTQILSWVNNLPQ